MATEQGSRISREQVDQARKAWLEAAEEARQVFASKSKGGDGHGDPNAKDTAWVNLDRLRLEVQQRLLEYHDARDAWDAQERAKGDVATRQLNHRSFIVAAVVGAATIVQIVMQLVKS